MVRSVLAWPARIRRLLARTDALPGRRERTEPAPPGIQGHPCGMMSEVPARGQAGSMRGRFGVLRRNVKIETRCPQSDQVVVPGGGPSWSCLSSAYGRGLGQHQPPSRSPRGRCRTARPGASGQICRGCAGSYEVASRSTAKPGRNGSTRPGNPETSSPRPSSVRSADGPLSVRARPPPGT
jgi:hypothetical protein